LTSPRYDERSLVIYSVFGILTRYGRRYARIVMKGYEPSERIWSALKKTAAAEKDPVTYEQAIRRVHRIISHEGVGLLPEPALRFYADEYVRMVRER